MKHAHNALDSTLGYAARDYNDQSVMKMRGKVCNGFRTGASLMYIAKRTHIEGTEARVISLLSSSLLSMSLPEQFAKLSPIFVLSKPKLTAATSDPDSIAAQFATTELIKTKLHLLAGDSILNTDGENHHYGHDQPGEGKHHDGVDGRLFDSAPVWRTRSDQAPVDPWVSRSGGG